MAAQITEACLQEGLILRPLPGDVVGICPPLIIREDEVDDLFDKLRRGLARVHAARRAAA
jgi:4-aminobutyrate--pyruvate transaminase